MRPRVLSLAAAALALGVVLAASAGAAPQARTAASAVQASGAEFRINLSRRAVRPGSVRVEFVNFGEDDHDLAIQRKGSSSSVYLPEVKPGKREVVTTRMRRGTYVFWCTISDHKARGMRAELKVRKAKKR